MTMACAGSETQRWQISHHFDTLHFFLKCTHSHMFRAAILWNCLPPSLTSECSLYKFKLSSGNLQLTTLIQSTEFRHLAVDFPRFSPHQSLYIPVVVLFFQSNEPLDRHIAFGLFHNNNNNIRSTCIARTCDLGPEIAHLKCTLFLQIR